MVKKEQIIYRPDVGIYEINGKKFMPKSAKYKNIDGIEHVDYEIIEEINEEEYSKHLNIVKKAILDSIPKERIAEEILKKYSTDALKKMANQITKKNAKASRQDGCLGIKLDGGKYNSSYIEIFN